MQSCNKRLRAAGKEASSFWGGATNPDGSLKKIAVYNTKGKKSARRKENEQRRSASRKDLKELFLERREELEKLGRWTGPRTLSVCTWLQELAVLCGSSMAKMRLLLQGFRRYSSWFVY